ncbi:MAG TPA: HIT family protein [Candidatus Nealsonbacteria bacterium]|uniref:HIT domain-containing protein n=1 Tax=marine sediment metagenome TaxID=412755 RepID=A0A0F9VSD0_9ZZZZ|nr:HIT family protein [Candidatus Nealsonbacteria bacterium]HEB46525.1 HIT family protein [Candidatus Nealsonbacteria bacterium]
MRCLFCNIIKGQKEAFKVWENRDFILFLDVKPINPGHVILITKKYIRDVFSVPEPLYGRMFQTVKRIARVLKKLTSAKRIGLAIEGFGAPHVHIHLVPVNKGNELNPLRARKVAEKKLRSMQSEFASRFKRLK